MATTRQSELSKKSSKASKRAASAKKASSSAEKKRKNDQRARKKKEIEERRRKEDEEIEEEESEEDDDSDDGEVEPSHIAKKPKPYTFRDMMYDEYEKLQEEHAKDKAKLAQIEKNGHRRSLAKMAMTTVMQKLLETTVKRYFWSKIKFVFPKEQNKYVRMVLKKAYEQFDEANKPSSNEEEDHFDTYFEFIIQHLNFLRTYVGTQLGDAAKVWMATHPVPNFTFEDNADSGIDADFDPDTSTILPATEDIIRCLLRDINLEDPSDKELMLWYTDDFLPKACAISKQFGPDLRYFDTISKARPLKAGEPPSMSIATETFAVVCFEANRSKWIWYERVKQSFPEVKNIIPAKYSNPVTKILGKDGEWQKTHKGIRVYGKHSISMYTKNDIGQKKEGGWTPEGINRFNELRNLAKEARKDPKTEALETKILELLREKHKITEDSHGAQAALSKSKAPTEAVESVTMESTWDDLEDEEA